MLIPNGFAQANFRFTGQNVPEGAEVTLGLDMTGFAGTPTDAAEALRDAWENEMLSQQTAQITLSEVLVKFGPNATGPSGTAASGQNGTAVGDSEAPQVAALISKQTAFGGRAGRGRMYLPGLHGDSFDAGGIMSSGNVAGLQTAINSFAAAVALTVGDPVLLHGADSPLGAPTPITAFVVSNKAATQRRRLRR